MVERIVEMKILFRKCLIKKWSFIGVVKLNWGQVHGWRVGYGIGYVDYLICPNKPLLIEFCFPYEY